MNNWEKYETREIISWIIQKNEKNPLEYLTTEKESGSVTTLKNKKCLKFFITTHQKTGRKRS